MYKLPTISTLLSFTKLRWLNIGRRAVSQYWSEKLRGEAAYKSTLINCNPAEMTIGRSYIALDNVSNNITDVKRGITIVQGKVADWCVLQTTKSRFSQHEVEQICPLCMLAAEGLSHMQLRCPALSEVRGPLLSSIRLLLISHLGPSWWLSHSGSQIVGLCVDSTKIKRQIQSTIEWGFLERLKILGRRFVINCT